MSKENLQVCSSFALQGASREEALEEAKKDKKNMQRNRRMFGSLLGTLQRFKSEDTKESEKDAAQRKKDLEQKIEEKTEKEKEEARREKQELFSERRKQRQDIRVLEVQMRRVREFESWEEAKRKEMFAIRTKAGTPPVYFMPRQDTDAESWISS